jgi:maltose-binding protein MalE
MQLPLSSPAVTARYYWGNIGAGNGQTVFKKDNGESAKYLAPDGRGELLNWLYLVF